MLLSIILGHSVDGLMLRNMYVYTVYTVYVLPLPEELRNKSEWERVKCFRHKGYQCKPELMSTSIDDIPEKKTLLAL